MHNLAETSSTHGGAHSRQSDYDIDFQFLATLEFPTWLAPTTTVERERLEARSGCQPAKMHGVNGLHQQHNSTFIADVMDPASDQSGTWRSGCLEDSLNAFAGQLPETCLSVAHLDIIHATTWEVSPPASS